MPTEINIINYLVKNQLPLTNNISRFTGLQYSVLIYNHLLLLHYGYCSLTYHNHYHINPRQMH